MDKADFYKYIVVEGCVFDEFNSEYEAEKSGMSGALYEIKRLINQKPKKPPKPKGECLDDLLKDT